ncbi:hypothetical protein BDM02DRAFT_2524210 [Thelephora ganbajun]|uniref:Uncharacterized protein n=1 Tax=Thelephora ganbajun TaxID=370292 RepID=A0ACB6ZDD4_THEGA|nr:hypothetical protein BDM02DRAFT_2524210 [Thelephora ganbajun]
MRKSYLFVLSFGVFAPGALAGFAECQSSWEWASNSKQQNPCEVAGALDAACWGFAEVVVPPLPPGANYITPQANSSTLECDCNAVMFSLYMGCTACQNVSTQPWSYWQKYCPHVYVSEYPQSIPPSTAIPNWAYVNYMLGDRFDTVAAKAAGDKPERLTPGPSTVLLPGSSTGSGSPSSTSVVESQQNNRPKTSGTPTGSIPTSPSSTATGFNQQKYSNVAAIVGGAIGGLGFLVMVGVGVWYFLRIRKTSRGEVGRDHPDYPRYPGGAFMSERNIQPPLLRLYVSSSSCDPTYFLTDLDRTRLTRQPSLTKLTM